MERAAEKTAVWDTVIRVLMIAAGNFLVAFGIAAFLIPCDLISGGCTGAALLINRLTGIRVSEAVFAINAVMFLFGLALLGKRFAMGTLLSSVLYPLFLRLLESAPALQGLTDDRMLSTLFAGLLVGAGIGIVFRAGASTGGTDPIPLVLNRYLGVPLTKAMYAVDLLIILAQAFFSEPEAILYGIVFVLLSSFLIGKIESAREPSVQILAISSEGSRICDTITRTCDIGATLFPIETGYGHVPQKAVMTVIRKRSVDRVRQAITAIDPCAFIQINEVSAVHGRGFTLER